MSKKKSKELKRKKKEMEYEDAPSGYVTLYNYKEPFMKFEEGYGYQGVLLFDGMSDAIQCHLCGGWFGALPHHLAREHNMTAATYKEMVGLRQTSALINESTRIKMIASGHKRFKNLIPGNRKKSEAERKKTSETLKANAIETANERGTCPAQILSRMKASYEKLGRTPGQDDWGVSDETIRRVWGSVENACAAAGIPYRKPSHTIAAEIKRGKLLEGIKRLVSDVTLFKKIHKSFPSQSDARRMVFGNKTHISNLKKAIRLAKKK